jgi:hypothetical protein
MFDDRDASDAHRKDLTYKTCTVSSTNWCRWWNGWIHPFCQFWELTRCVSKLINSNKKIIWIKYPSGKDQEYGTELKKGSESFSGWRVRQVEIWKTLKFLFDEILISSAMKIRGHSWLIASSKGTKGRGFTLKHRRLQSFSRFKTLGFDSFCSHWCATVWTG